MEQYEGGYEYQDQPKKNVLGVVGFALSFCTGPIGLIVSLIALKDRPRGFAIAGVIISLISTVVWGLVGWFFFWAGTLGMKIEEVEGEALVMQRAVAAYQQSNNGALPPDLASLSLPVDETVDPWGNSYRIEPTPDGTDWVVVSAGLDMTFDTGDDIRIGSTMSEAEITQEVGQKIGKHFEEKFGGSNP